MLKCTITDGDKNVWNRKSLVGQIYKACKNFKYLKPVVICCVIHQQMFCGEYLKL